MYILRDSFVQPLYFLLLSYCILSECHFDVKVQFQSNTGVCLSLLESNVHVVSPNNCSCCCGLFKWHVKLSPNRLI